MSRKLWMSLLKYYRIRHDLYNFTLCWLHYRLNTNIERFEGVVDDRAWTSWFDHPTREQILLLPLLKSDAGNWNGMWIIVYFLLRQCSNSTQYRSVPLKNLNLKSLDKNCERDFRNIIDFDMTFNILLYICLTAIYYGARTQLKICKCRSGRFGVMCLTYIIPSEKSQKRGTIVLAHARDCLVHVKSLN